MTLIAAIQEKNRVTIMGDTLFREFEPDGSEVLTYRSKFCWAGRDVLYAWAGYRSSDSAGISVKSDIGSRAAARLAFDRVASDHRAAGAAIVTYRPDLKAHVEADPTPEFLAVTLGGQFGPELVRMTDRGEECARNGQILSVGPWPDFEARWWRNGTSARVRLLDAMAGAIEAQQGRRVADFPLDVWTLEGNNATHERLTKEEALAAIEVAKETEAFSAKR